MAGPADERTGVCTHRSAEGPVRGLARVAVVAVRSCPWRQVHEDPIVPSGPRAARYALHFARCAGRDLI